MKRLIWFGFCCLLAPGAFAEHPGGGAVSGGHTGSVAAGHNNPGHGTSGRNTARAHGSTRSYGYGRYGGYGYGGYYDPLYDSGYYPSDEAGGPNTTIVYPPAAPYAMTTQTAHPVIHEYAQPEDYGNPPEPQSAPILYLIAFRDHTIRAAMTYWIQDGAVHYLDTEHQEKHAPVASIDRELSVQLNRERHVPFSLP